MKDSIKQLIEDMRQTANYRWAGYDEHCENHDSTLQEFADRLAALTDEQP